jgi:hypothetical protein
MSKSGLGISCHLSVGVLRVFLADVGFGAESGKESRPKEVRRWVTRRTTSVTPPADQGRPAPRRRSPRRADAAAYRRIEVYGKPTDEAEQDVRAGVAKAGPPSFSAPVRDDARAAAIGQHLADASAARVARELPCEAPKEPQMSAEDYIKASLVRALSGQGRPRARGADW